MYSLPAGIVSRVRWGGTNVPSELTGGRPVLSNAEGDRTAENRHGAAGAGRQTASIVEGGFVAML